MESDLSPWENQRRLWRCDKMLETYLFNKDGEEFPCEVVLTNDPSISGRKCGSCGARQVRCFCRFIGQNHITTACCTWNRENCCVLSEDEIASLAEEHHPE